MKYLITLLCLFFLSNCATTSQAPIPQFGFVIDSESSAIANVTQNGIEHEFTYLNYDKSESGIRFQAKVKNISKQNKIFNIKDVVLVINSVVDGKPVQWKIPARDASLADKDLLTQIADLENRKSGDIFVSNIAPKTNRENELKSIKERRKELAEKSFYTTNIVPAEVITGLMYFSISDESFLTAPKTTMHIIVKSSKSKDMVFKYKTVSAVN